MTKTNKRTGPKLAPLVLWAAIVPMFLATIIASLGGMAAIQQWVPQSAVRYLSYITAIVFYLIGPLPIIAKIKKYPLPVAYIFAICWTAVFAIVNQLIWPDAKTDDIALWIIIGTTATVSGILGTKILGR